MSPVFQIFAAMPGFDVRRWRLTLNTILNIISANERKVKGSMRCAGRGAVNQM
jgi:hypothetical protein